MVSRKCLFARLLAATSARWSLKSPGQRCNGTQATAPEPGLHISLCVRLFIDCVHRDFHDCNLEREDPYARAFSTSRVQEGCERFLPMGMNSFKLPPGFACQCIPRTVFLMYGVSGPPHGVFNSLHVSMLMGKSKGTSWCRSLTCINVSSFQVVCL